MMKFIARYLEPIEILSELIFSLLIVMTFTMAVRSINREWLQRPDAADTVRGLLVAALGCALAWALIDAALYLVTSLEERNLSLRWLRTVQAAPTPEAAAALVGEELAGPLGQIVSEADYDVLERAVVRRAKTLRPAAPGLTREDWLGALVLFCVATLGTVPVIIPLLFISDPFWALRTSNLLSVAMLFGVGYEWARFVGSARPVRTGVMIALIGVVLVVIAIPLGG